MADLLFYKKLVALNKDQHLHHSFKKFDSLEFAANAQTVLLTGSEFAEASKEYPIVFIKAPDGSMMPVALLSFRENENLYVGADGKWNARYIPAYVRRYPFIFVEASAEQFVVCVDEDCGGLNVAGDGERLFDDQGEASPFVNSMVQFMQDYQVDFLRTRAFMERLLQLDLLKENNAKFTLNTGAEFLINGIWMVDEAKLATLSDENLLQLAKTGELGRIYAHLISLSNLSQLAEFDAKKTLGVK
jgi:hypothetical protein